MTTQIKCPYCDKSFEPTDAYKHELEDKLHKELQLKHQEEVEKLTREKQELVLTKDKELETVKKQVAESVRLETEKKTKQEFQITIDTAKQEAEKKARQNTKLQEQLEEEVKRVGEMKSEKDKLRVAHERELEETKKHVAETSRLETEKKIKQELQATMDAANQEAETKAKQNTQLQVQLEEQVKRLGEMKDEKDTLRLVHENEIEETRKKTTETVRKEAEIKIRQELEIKITSTQEEAQAREKQNKELQEQIREMLKQMREIKDEKDTLGIEYEKKLLEGQDKIKQTAKRGVQEELGLRIAEKDKKIQDTEKQVLELQRKLQEGSQQLQGEVQELELEKLLATEFPFDEIKEVPKGIRGADALQVVRTQTGVVCGTIIWESKRTKNWSPGWIQKLKDDKRAVKADIAVLVSSVLPQTIRMYGKIDDVLVADLQSAMSIAYLLREQLMKVHAAHVANTGKTTKAEIVYNYLISNEFKQRLEVWIEYFRDRQKKIIKERMYFNKKWQEEEKSIHKVIANTSGMYGDLQGLTENALPKVSQFELPESIEDSETD